MNVVKGEGRGGEDEEEERGELNEGRDMIPD